MKKSKSTNTKKTAKMSGKRAAGKAATAARSRGGGRSKVSAIGKVISEFTILHWFLSFAIMVVAVLCVVALVSLFSADDKATIKAYAAGKYARIILDSGEIEGNVALSVKDALYMSGRFDDMLGISEDDEPVKDRKRFSKQANKDRRDDTSSASTEGEGAAREDEKSDSEPQQEKQQKEEKESVSQESQEQEEGGIIAENDSSNNTITIKKESIDKVNPLEEVEKRKLLPNLKTVRTRIDDNMLYKHKKYGYLPKLDKNNNEPWKYYAHKDSTDRSKPAIALIVTGLGFSEVIAQRAMSLPSQVSLSFSPYSRGLVNWSERVRNAGHEIWLDMPMEFADYPASDPGPLGLMKSLSPRENKDRLLQVMGRAIGYVGLLGVNNERFSANSMMQDVYREIAKRGVLLLLHDRTFKPEFDDSNLLYATHYISRDDSAQQIQQTLSEMEAVAKNHGIAIGVIESSPGLFKVINRWISDLGDKNIALVPVSAMIKRKK